MVIFLLAGCQEPIDEGYLTNGDHAPAIAHPLLERDFEQLKSSGVLRVITRYNSSTYFVHKGGQAGFDFELIDRFAQKHGLHVEVVVPKQGQEPISMLNAGEGDVICRGQSLRPEFEKWVLATRPTNFVRKLVVLPSDSPRDPDIASLAGLTLTIAADDNFRSELLRLKAEKRWQVFIATARPGYDPEELLAQLDRGQLEAVVVDDIVAKAAMMNLDHLKLGAVLGERRATAWYVRQNSPVLQTQLNLITGHGTITNIVIYLCLSNFVHNRLAYFHGNIVIFTFHRIGTIVARAAINDSNMRIRDKSQHLFSFHADFLHTLVAGNVIGNIPQAAFKISRKHTGFVSQHEILKWVVKGPLHFFYLLILREH